MASESMEITNELVIELGTELSANEMVRMRLDEFKIPVPTEDRPAMALIIASSRNFGERWTILEALKRFLAKSSNKCYILHSDNLWYSLEEDCYSLNLLKARLTDRAYNMLSPAARVPSKYLSAVHLTSKRDVAAVAPEAKFDRPDCICLQTAAGFVHWDLQSGESRSLQPSDYASCYIDVSGPRSAEAKAWLEQLWPQVQLIGETELSLQQLLGYFITGETSEKCGLVFRDCDFLASLLMRACNQYAYQGPLRHLAREAKRLFKLSADEALSEVPIAAVVHECRAKMLITDCVGPARPELEDEHRARRLRFLYIPAAVEYEYDQLPFKDQVATELVYWLLDGAKAWFQLRASEVDSE